MSSMGACCAKNGADDDDELQKPAQEGQAEDSTAKETEPAVEVQDVAMEPKQEVAENKAAAPITFANELDELMEVTPQSSNLPSKTLAEQDEPASSPPPDVPDEKPQEVPQDPWHDLPEVPPEAPGEEMQQVPEGAEQVPEPAQVVPDVEEAAQEVPEVTPEPWQEAEAAPPEGESAEKAPEEPVDEALKDSQLVGETTEDRKEDESEANRETDLDEKLREMEAQKSAAPSPVPTSPSLEPTAPPESEVSVITYHYNCTYRVVLCVSGFEAGFASFVAHCRTRLSLPSSHLRRV